MKPARCPGCTGWCHRWNSHTLSDPEPCPWKGWWRSSTNSVRLKHHNLLQPQWARSLCLFCTTQSHLLKECVPDPCWTMPIYFLTLETTELTSCGKVMVLSSVLCYYTQLQNTMWTWVLRLLTYGQGPYILKKANAIYSKSFLCSLHYIVITTPWVMTGVKNI